MGTIPFADNGKKLLADFCGKRIGNKYILSLYVYPDSKNGDVKITIVGYNSNGFTLSYKKAEAGAIGLEIKALASDDAGTKIIYKECAPSASA